MPPDFLLRWDYDRPVQEEERFRQMLPVAEASGDQEYYLGLLTQIARAQYHQHRFDAARLTLDRVESLLTASTKTARIRYLLERGRLLTISGQRDQAIPLFKQAFDLATAAGEAYHSVDAANMVAIASPDPAEREDWGRTAIDLVEKHPSTAVFLGSLLYNMGLTYARTGRHDEALAIFERARAVYAEQKRHEGERLVQWAIAKTLRLSGRPAKALSLLMVLAATGEENGRVQEEIGECYLALGRPEGCRAHFDRAYRVLSHDPFFGWDDPARIERLRALKDR